MFACVSGRGYHDMLSETDKRQLIEKLVAYAAEFQARAYYAREETSVKYLAEEDKDISNLRLIIDGLLAKLASTVNSEIETRTEESSYQLYLIASFVRTHYLINELIINGDLVEAQTLIRKQMESFARMRELDSYPISKLLKRTPNIKNFSEPPGRAVYSMLSEIAHFSTHAAGKLLSIKNESGQNLIYLHPQYNGYSAECYNVHVYICLNFLSWFIEKIKKFYPLYDDEGDVFMLQSAFFLAYKSGVVKQA
jgi:hypothetical protein